MIKYTNIPSTLIEINLYQKKLPIIRPCVHQNTFVDNTDLIPSKKIIPSQFSEHKCFPQNQLAQIGH